MDKIFSMFRVFDIAFFAPGIFLWYILTEHIGDIVIFATSNPELATVDGLFQLVQQIGLIFVLGLLVHGLQRSITKKFNFLRVTKATRASWYLQLEKSKQEDLALYFWYLRATAYNLAIVCLIAIFIFLVLLIRGEHTLKWILSSSGGALAMVLFFYIGREFNFALKNIRPTAPERPSRDRKSQDDTGG